MSSDATVLCQDSEAEDDLQSLLYEQTSHLREAQLREHQQQALLYATRTANVPLGFESFGANAAVQRQSIVNGSRFPAEAFQRELFRPRRGPSLSWGFQQEMADYEASHQSGMRGVGGIPYPSQPSGYVIRNDLQPPSAKHPRYTCFTQSHRDYCVDRRRGRSGKRDQTRNEQMDERHMHGHVDATCAQSGQQKHVKGRRRGRRGGRGRKPAERPTDDLPRLEQYTLLT